MRTMIAVFIAAALALSGCGGPEAPPPESPVSPASPASQETLSESPASQLDPEPAPDPDDALAQEIILAYGGEMVTQKDGTHLKTKLFSLFQMPYSWHRPEEIPPEWRSLWFLTTIGEEDQPDRYADPQEEGGWLFPQEVYEERLAARFGADPEILRASPDYDQERKGYRMAGGGDGGVQQKITYEFQRQESYVVIDITLEDEYNNSWAQQFRLIADLREDGGWTFRSCECQPRELPLWGEEQGDLTVLTAEQWELLDQAEQWVRIFQVSTDSMENYYGTVDYGNPVQIDGYGGRCLYTGDRYQSFQDLRAQSCTSLTEAFFDSLNQYGTFVDYQGNLYVLDGARGTNNTYLWGKDRFSSQQLGEDRILLTRYAYYTDEALFDQENAEPARVRAMPILLNKTAEGWRVDHLELPY